MSDPTGDAGMKEVRIGIRITLPPDQGGPSFLGADEVNALIAEGWRVTAIVPAAIVAKKSGESESEAMVRLVLTGWDMAVRLDRPPPPRPWWRLW
ncbi:MAG TPA: hypothetical protein VF796_01035 [Humisphaera sp.]